MGKILKKYTTIPQHLYVERNADLQLKRIIEEMQRPGYVLVARQMGKTNLLFNAKRTLENESRLFAYVDLSNLYDKEVECYRNIINNIVEPNYTIFGDLEENIDQIRQKSLPAHNEYSRSLRLILSRIKGDLVIILDEIDALKSVSYSDNIFAQIRSNYFSRTNFPEFERLTYVLSGVIEPTELITDTNKSPFNIGEKIYLDDFTRSEHEDFITKGKLNVSPAISQEIYNWTHGNPRLTFDICSEIENNLIDNELINIDTIRKIIKQKYLTHFDIAPIDHIRELVKANSTIRKALHNINNNTTEDITDEIKSKLYLFGIINSNFEGNIKIKNKIIEECLTEEWLKSIDKNKEISLVYGLAKYTSNEFDEAIEIFENILSNSNTSQDNIDSCNYFIGLSYFKTGKYKKAIEFFNYNFSSESNAADSKSFLGICKIAIGDKVEGIEILENRIKYESNNYAYYNALLNLALNIDDQDLSCSLFDRLFDSTFKAEKEKDEDLNELRTLSLFYQSEIYLKSGKINEALGKINQALEYSNDSETIFLKYLIYVIEPNKDESIKEYILSAIFNNSLSIKSKNNTNSLSFNESHLPYYLNLVFDEIDLNNFEKLIDFSIEKLQNKSDKYNLIYSVSRISESKKNTILNYLLRFEDILNENLLFNIYKDLCLINLSDSLENIYFKKYSILFSKNKSIDARDIYLFAIEIKNNFNNQKNEYALELSEIIDNKLSDIQDEKTKFESLIIYYWKASLYFSQNDKINANKYVNITLDLIEKSHEKHTSAIDENGLQTIKNQLIQIKESSKGVTYIIDKKYERNEIVKVKYYDGKVLEKKYKQLEFDILEQKCKII